MGTILDVLDELKNWGDAYKEKLDTEKKLRQTVEQCVQIREKAVESFNGWVSGAIPVPQDHEREQEIANINELARNVSNMRDKLVELYDYLNGWEATMSNLPNQHRRLLELMYKHKKSLEQISFEMGISKTQVLKIKQQSINLLKSIG